MSGEFKNRIEALDLDEATKQKVLNVIEEAGFDFPCLLCSSNSTCENFQWYLKWFNK
ncbi:MAG: hypothetical protein LBH74_01350 [Nitrososphaerota archaeon]|jgi:hypothetical protein|uniref:hypothetical protein n=1 Tax=Candidatus Bathycorpusculum sp. TaxID=2994959 RepID=UPI002828F135|nr:hypothetical protein [Candidatus Termitimicrobium sp.]MCL2432535.1 hypothetical protein [Candidatus Termitimicrobium sp.]MDR0492275.1 hypothetical protein [Nitrososphaerota archaeon]